jgi:hypothetical protein
MYFYSEVLVTVKPKDSSACTQDKKAHTQPPESEMKVESGKEQEEEDDPKDDPI